MKKNGSNKRQQPKKQPSKKATANKSGKSNKKNNAKKDSPKKADTRKPGNVRSIKPKEIQKTRAIKKELPRIKEVKYSNLQKTYNGADSSAKIRNVIKKNGRLRYKGKFVSHEVQEKVLQFAKQLDKENIEYSLAEIMEIPDLQKKVLITKDETGKLLFYWNLHNKVLKGSFGEYLKIEIKDFDGKTIYKGVSELKASLIIHKLNRKIQNLEKIIIIKENVDNIYPMIPVYETRRDGENIKILIDFSGIQVRIPDDMWNKYRSML